MTGEVVPFPTAGGGPERIQDVAAAALFRRRMVLVRSPIDGTVAGDVAAQLLSLDAASDEPVTLMIDSPGGDLGGMFTILDTIRTMAAPVNTRCAGTAASVAAAILASGTGRRSATPHARISLHLPRVAAPAGAAGVEAAAREIEFLRARLEEILAQATGQSIERVRADTGRDFWMSADEALAYGIVDEVVAPRH